jgi:hypothetical protein
MEAEKVKKARAHMAIFEEVELKLLSFKFVIEAGHLFYMEFAIS